MKKIRRILRNLLRTVLPLRWQLRSGLISSRASVEPLREILSQLSREGKLSVIEIGTRYGQSLAYLATHFRVTKYIAVDPYIDYEEYSGDGFDEILRSTNADSIFEETRTLGGKLLGHRFKLLRHFSSDAVLLIEDEVADFIFVDGNHRYPFVLEDLENYWPKVRPGGYLCGHDFFMRSKLENGHYDEPMVYEAVRDFAAKRSLQVETYGEHRGYPMCFAIKKEN